MHVIQRCDMKCVRYESYRQMCRWWDACRRSDVLLWLTCFLSLSFFFCSASSLFHLSSSSHFPFLDLHHAALALQSLGTGLLPWTLAVNVEAHVPLLVQVEKLLKELSYVVVGLGWRLHEGALPLVGLSLSVLGVHLPLGLVTLVTHEHDGNGLDVAFNGQNLQWQRDIKSILSAFISIFTDGPVDRESLY